MPKRRVISSCALLPCCCATKHFRGDFPGLNRFVVQPPVGVRISFQHGDAGSRPGEQSRCPGVSRHGGSSHSARMLCFPQEWFLMAGECAKSRSPKRSKITLSSGCRSEIYMVYSLSSFSAGLDGAKYFTIRDRFLSSFGLNSTSFMLSSMKNTVTFNSGRHPFF